MIRCKLSSLMGEKHILKLSDLARDTGINRNTLTSMYYDRVIRIDVAVADTLCKYFDCTMSDIFEYIDNDLLEAVKKRGNLTIESYENIEEPKISSSKYIFTRVHTQFVASNVVKHLEKRIADNEDKVKSLLITRTQVNAVELYDEIVKLRPEWHSEDLNDGVIKVLMSSAIAEHGLHRPIAEYREILYKRMMDDNDKLKLVIVIDMWIHGPSGPDINTVYLNRKLQGSRLVQVVDKLSNSNKRKINPVLVDFVGLDFITRSLEM